MLPQLPCTVSKMPLRNWSDGLRYADENNVTLILVVRNSNFMAQKLLDQPHFEDAPIAIVKLRFVFEDLRPKGQISIGKVERPSIDLLLVGANIEVGQPWSALRDDKIHGERIEFCELLVGQANELVGRDAGIVEEPIGLLWD